MLVYLDATKLVMPNDDVVRNPLDIRCETARVRDEYPDSVAFHMSWSCIRSYRVHHIGDYGPCGHIPLLDSGEQFGSWYDHQRELHACYHRWTAHSRVPFHSTLWAVDCGDDIREAVANTHGAEDHRSNR